MFEMGNRWGKAKGDGEEGGEGGRSVYGQPGTRVDGKRTTTQRRDSK